MKEEEIRPEALAQRYYELSAQDADRCFPANHLRADVACVGCGEFDALHQFDKNGFAYSRCQVCGSLYQSPRPPIAAFEAFYRDSESSNYWSDVFFPAVAEVRREKIFAPRVERLSSMCRAQGGEVASIVDVGAGFGIFLDEWRKRFPQSRCVAVEPSAHLAAECRAKGFETVEEIAENVRGYEGLADLVACFEVLEHVYEPVEFVRTLANLARPGGLVAITTLGVDGFDIQTLWDNSNAIFPPHHINFLSIKGFRRLFERAGLTDIEIATPGQLDVDIVRNAAAKDSSLLQGQRFVEAVLADDGRAAAFQSFLVENKLSSHTWVMGRRPITGSSNA